MLFPEAFYVQHIFYNKGINLQTISNYDCNNNGDIFILGYTAISFDDIEPGIKAIIDEIKD